jgi:hypothetical protein
MTFSIVSLLQLRVGSESKTLEIYFTDWMKSLSASKRIQDVAAGGKEMTTDLIREFTTPDGRKVYIHETKKSLERDKASEKTGIIESGVIQKLMSGLKLDVKDLNASTQLLMKDQIKKEVEKEVIKDYESRLRKSGIDPETLDAKK